MSQHTVGTSERMIEYPCSAKRSSPVEWSVIPDSLHYLDSKLICLAGPNGAADGISSQCTCLTAGQRHPLVTMNTETDNTGTHRKNIHPGLVVDVILKKDQTTGKLIRGVVREILTNSSVHPRGIRVRLSNGQVGRVRTIPKQPSGRPVM